MITMQRHIQKYHWDHHSSRPSPGPLRRRPDLSWLRVGARRTRAGTDQSPQRFVEADYYPRMRTGLGVIGSPCYHGQNRCRGRARRAARPIMMPPIASLSGDDHLDGVRSVVQAWGWPNPTVTVTKQGVSTPGWSWPGDLTANKNK